MTVKRIETSINPLRSTSVENFRNSKRERALNRINADQRIVFEEEVYNYDISWMKMFYYAVAFLGAVGMTYALIMLSVFFN